MIRKRIGLKINSFMNTPYNHLLFFDIDFYDTYYHIYNPSQVRMNFIEGCEPISIRYLSIGIERIALLC